LRSPNAGSSIGPELREEDAPGILVVVAEMARKVGAAPPDEIRLTYLPCCGVLEQRRCAGLRPGRRVLVIGLPLLYVLSVEELRAAVAHELAHLSRGDAALAFMSSHFMDAIDQSIERGTATPRGWMNPCVIFAWLTRAVFRVLSSPLGRYQEFRADAVAASVCGGDVATSSLRNAALVQPIFKEVLCDYHPVVLAEANLYQFFWAAWDAIGEPLKEEIKDSLLNEERPAFFSLHPTLRVRLRRLERFAPHREPDMRPARRLLARRRELENELHDFIYRRRTPRLALYEPAAD
jgi:Zn-dependent protease with chaperone function